MAQSEPGAVVVRQPDEGESYWQPVPANGYSEVRVSKRDSEKIQGFSSGVQVIAAGCHVREHQHGTEQELLFFFEGTGKVLVNGEEHSVRPGTMVYAGHQNARPVCGAAAGIGHLVHRLQNQFQMVLVDAHIGRRRLRAAGQRAVEAGLADESIDPDYVMETTMKAAEQHNNV